MRTGVSPLPAVCVWAAFARSSLWCLCGVLAASRSLPVVCPFATNAGHPSSYGFESSPCACELLLCCLFSRQAGWMRLSVKLNALEAHSWRPQLVRSCEAHDSAVIARQSLLLPSTCLDLSTVAHSSAVMTGAPPPPPPGFPLAGVHALPPVPPPWTEHSESAADFDDHCLARAVTACDSVNQLLVHAVHRCIGRPALVVTRRRRLEPRRTLALAAQRRRVRGHEHGHGYEQLTLDSRGARYTKQRHP